MEKLNKKLAEWVGLFVNSYIDEHWIGLYEDKVIRLEPFTDSLDACFKWLVPKASEDGYEVAISTEGKDCYGDLFGQGQGGWFKAVAETPALALCLAIEKLIDGDKDG